MRAFFCAPMKTLKPVQQCNKIIQIRDKLLFASKNLPVFDY